MRPILKFLSEVKAEFRNISWPSRESLIRLTFVVISISILISLILGGFDYLFPQGIALLGQQTTAVKTPASVIPTISLPSPVATDAAKPTIKLIQTK